MAFSSKFVRFCSSVVNQETAKGTRLQRLGNYVKNVADDYKTVAIEIGQDMQERPVKSAVYISLLSSMAVLFKTNPSEREFHTRLTECVEDLMLVGDLIRNPHSQAKIEQFARDASDKTLRCYNLGLFSLMSRTTHGPDLGLYKAKCKYIKPHFTEWYKTIVDVGVLGKWRYLEGAMQNYDINSDEWLEDGHPNKDYIFYKNNNLVSWDMKMK